MFYEMVTERKAFDREDVESLAAEHSGKHARTAAPCESESASSAQRPDHEGAGEGSGGALPERPGTAGRSREMQRVEACGKEAGSTQEPRRLLQGEPRGTGKICGARWQQAGSAARVAAAARPAVSQAVGPRPVAPAVTAAPSGSQAVGRWPNQLELAVPKAAAAAAGVGGEAASRPISPEEFRRSNLSNQFITSSVAKPTDGRVEAPSASDVFGGSRRAGGRNVRATGPTDARGSEDRSRSHDGRRRGREAAAA